MSTEFDKQLAKDIVVASLNNKILKLPSTNNLPTMGDPKIPEYNKFCAEHIALFYLEILKTIENANNKS